MLSSSRWQGNFQELEAKVKDLTFEAKAKNFKMCPRGLHLWQFELYLFFAVLPTDGSLTTVHSPVREADDSETIVESRYAADSRSIRYKPARCVQSAINSKRHTKAAFTRATFLRAIFW